MWVGIALTSTAQKFGCICIVGKVGLWVRQIVLNNVIYL